MSSIDNFIGTFENSVSKEFCDKYIQLIDNGIAMGFGTNRPNHAHIKNDVSLNFSSTQILTNNFFVTQFGDFLPVLWSNYTQYASQYSILLEHQPIMVETKAQRTPIGGGYHVWHCESTKATNSARILAWLLYLNDVDEGGETEFLYYPKRIKPEAGKLIMFPSNFTHTHRGNPPISNMKYILTGWVEIQPAGL